MVDAVPRMRVEAGLVAEHLANGDGRLAGGGELGPVMSDRLRVVEQAAVCEDVEQRGGHTLGGGITEPERVFLPWASALVAGAAPDVHDRLTPVVDTQGSPGVLTLELSTENLRQVGEVRVDSAVDGAVPMDPPWIRGVSLNHPPHSSNNGRSGSGGFEGGNTCAS